MKSAAPGQKFMKNDHRWTIHRRGRSFRVYAVEPRQYAPHNHASTFTLTLRELLFPPTHRASPTSGAFRPPDAFDLITFPEAFLPVRSLLEVLGQFSRFDELPCLHTGLRPSEDKEHHLFSVGQLQDLVTSIAGIDGVSAGDLKDFQAWLDSRDSGGFYNMGCLAALDTDGLTRVCLHPKLVRSKYEVSTFHEGHMVEANLLTVVSLLPHDKSYRTVNIQPLLCSDAIFDSTDDGVGGPLIALNKHAACFDDPPDHIDIVSVATCTPQPLRKYDGDRKHPHWHQMFRDSFKRVAEGGSEARHTHSVFVLSNFQSIEAKQAGLSGAWMPVAPVPGPLPKYVVMEGFGQDKKDQEDNTWLPFMNPENTDLRCRGFLASLAADERSDAPVVRAIGFTIDRLPRDCSLWSTTRHALSKFKLWEPNPAPTGIDPFSSISEVP